MKKKNKKQKNYQTTSISWLIELVYYLTLLLSLIPIQFFPTGVKRRVVLWMFAFSKLFNSL